MSRVVPLDGEHLSLDDVVAVAHGARADLRPQARARLERAAGALAQALAGGAALYGINTGFGPFARQRISAAEIEALQVNLLRSHAVGYGDLLPVPHVRAMLALRAHSLSRGYSGVGPALVEALVALLNAGVTPAVPEQGSVGASGDLAPLAHLGLALLGEGEAFHAGERLAAAEALRRAGLVPYRPTTKEGLALINGTQYMTAAGVLACAEAQLLLDAAQIAAALSIEALLGSVRAFDARLHALRPHPGQRAVAANLRALLAGSEIVDSHAGCDRVQDAYSLRCAPQVLGASLDALRGVERVLAIEVDAVTDNPLVFPEDGAVISGGHFHGQPVALGLDHLGVAVAEIASLAERRLFRLLYSDVEALPRCLARRPGVESGLMMVQYLAAALVSECRTLGHPATLDNVVTGGGVEDHNSMGSIAAARLARLLRNARGVVAAELLAAAEAHEYHTAHRAAPATAAAHAAVRRRVPRLDGDRILAPDVQKLAEVEVLQEIVAAVEAARGGEALQRGTA
jgi:histidine ammonia-lyase